MKGVWSLVKEATSSRSNRTELVQSLRDSVARKGSLLRVALREERFTLIMRIARQAFVAVLVDPEQLSCARQPLRVLGAASSPAAVCLLSNSMLPSERMDTTMQRTDSMS